MKIKLTLTPEGAEIVKKMYENGELAEFGVIDMKVEEPDLSEVVDRKRVDTEVERRDTPERNDGSLAP